MWYAGLWRRTTILKLVVILVDSQKKPKSERSHKKDSKSGIMNEPRNFLEGVSYLGSPGNARIAH